MDRLFNERLSRLRKEKKISQRQVAADLHISQALLSHYENGIREPGLDFVCRVCEYYGVSADYILGRIEEGAESAQMQFLTDLAECSGGVLALSAQLTERLMALEVQITQQMQKENPTP